MYPKVGLLEETKRGRKEEKIANNNEPHHIYLEIRHNKTH
jgi:hypothetical protein